MKNYSRIFFIDCQIFHYVFNKLDIFTDNHNSLYSSTIRMSELDIEAQIILNYFLCVIGKMNFELRDETEMIFMCTYFI